MDQKPRIGLVLMRQDLPGCTEAEQVIEALQADTQEIVDRLKRHFDVRGPWSVHSLDSLESCTGSLLPGDLDMVVLAFQTWSDGALLQPVLEALAGCPLVLWCYLPWQRLPRPASQVTLLRGSGPVGTFSALGTLRNLGSAFLFTFGAPDDPRLIADLQVAGRAAQLRSRLRSARFGLLPGQRYQPQSVFVDESKLAADIGPQVQVISPAEYSQAVRSVDPARVEGYLAQLRVQFDVAEDVSAQTLSQAAQISLGLLDLALANHLDLLAVQASTEELTEPYALRPGLYPDLAGEYPIIFQPESDLGAATANYILHYLTGSPTMLVELLFWDEPRTQVVGGHIGMQNPALASRGEVWISGDPEFCRPQGHRGAQFQLVTRPGRVTLFQLRSTPEGWQAVALSGVCLEERPWVEAIPHAIIRLDTTIEHFLNRAAEVGVTQHWIMAYGTVLHELEAFCQLTRIPLEVMN